jgi:uncharacterized membrane protein YsdA (DUF1294 family)
MVSAMLAGVLVLYAAASLVAFVAYGVDKSAAQRGTWRTPEIILHMLSLSGGWPGALMAQKIFRHKSRKPSFQAIFWATVAVNVGALAWFLS